MPEIIPFPAPVDLSRVALCGAIEDHPDGGVRLIVDAEIRNGSTATVAEVHASTFARALMFAINEFDLVDVFDARGPANAGYCG